MAVAVSLAKIIILKGRGLSVWAGISRDAGLATPVQNRQIGPVPVTLTPQKKTKQRPKATQKQKFATNQLAFTLQVAGRWPMTTYVAASMAQCANDLSPA